MGRKYKEPTPYRDKRCPYCGTYFTARGLNGHIRFYHGGYEREEIARLKEKLFNRALVLISKGHREVECLLPQLGPYSQVTLEELREIEDILDGFE